MGPRLQSRQAARLPGGTEFRLRQLAHAGRRAADRGAADAGADAARPGRHRAGRCRLPGFLPAAGAPWHAARAPRRPAQLRPGPATEGAQRRKKAAMRQFLTLYGALKYGVATPGGDAATLRTLTTLL